MARLSRSFLGLDWVHEAKVASGSGAPNEPTPRRFEAIPPQVDNACCQLVPRDPL